METTVKKPLSAAAAALLMLGLASGCTSNAATSSESSIASVRDQGVLRAGIRTDNPPHSFIDTDSGEWVGFDIEIAEALARELDVKLEKVKVDELTRISFLQSGRIDVAVASMSHTIERDKEIDFSQTYFCSKQTFLVKEGTTSLAALYGQPVAASRGSSSIGNWEDYLEAHGQSPEAAQIREFANKDAAAQAVSQGAVAGWAEDYEVLARYAAKDPSLTVLGDEGIGVKLDGIGVRADDSATRDEVNFALQRIFASGEYDEIYDRWFGPSSETPVPRDCDLEVWPNG
jgi:polar amino acid transport system substrate-binding protein